MALGRSGDNDQRKMRRTGMLFYNTVWKLQNFTLMTKKIREMKIFTNKLVQIDFTKYFQEIDFT